MKSQQSGFTLVELVLVIVILGILAAFAVPRFINLSSAARASAMQGLHGSVRSASALVRSLAVVGQQENLNPGSVTVEGTAVATVFGYPAGTTAAMNAIIADISAADFTVTDAGGVVTFVHAGAAGCSFTYTEAANATTPPVVTAAPVAAAC